VEGRKKRRGKEGKKKKKGKEECVSRKERTKEAESLLCPLPSTFLLGYFKC
jgi:hypothetical protein